MRRIWKLLSRINTRSGRIFTLVYAAIVICVTTLLPLHFGPQGFGDAWHDRLLSGLVFGFFVFVGIPLVLLPPLWIAVQVHEIVSCYATALRTLGRVLARRLRRRESG